MLTVQCVGPESSGTRWLTDIVNSFDDVTALHRSVPFGDHWWPDMGAADKYIVIWRDRDTTITSQRAAGHLKAWNRITPLERYYASVGLIREHLYEDNIPYIELKYEYLIDNYALQVKRIATFLDKDVPTILPSIRPSATVAEPVNHDESSFTV